MSTQIKSLRHMPVYVDSVEGEIFIEYRITTRPDILLRLTPDEADAIADALKIDAAKVRET